MTTPPRKAIGEMPDWPRFLTREEAAAYVGVAVATFDEEVKAGIWPAPLTRPIGTEKRGRLTWDRVALDHAATLQSAKQ